MLFVRAVQVECCRKLFYLVLLFDSPQPFLVVLAVARQSNYAQLDSMYAAAQYLVHLVNRTEIKTS